MSEDKYRNELENENSIKAKLDFSNLRKPLGIFAIGLVLCIICAPLTTSVNPGVFLGILILIIGSILLLFALYKEFYRMGIDMPFPFNIIFPSYPVVRDSDKITRLLSGFRSAFSDYFSTSGLPENSKLQDYSSQLFWHSVYLWKKRMNQNGLSLKFESNRRAYTSKKNSVRSEEYFDGRYDINDIYEEIDATRTFYRNGKKIKTLRDNEVAHYTILSAKEVGDDKILCPNCGGTTTKRNLIDGCDFCNTKFTVEDMENSVGSFGFRRDFSVSESKREAVKERIYPWVFLITEMPYIYFGFFGAFLYLDESVIAKFFTGIVAAGLFGLFGWFFVKINMAIVLPIAITYNFSKEKANSKLIYRSKEAKEQEDTVANYVRRFNSKFSIQSFFGGIQNKIYAIHFADNANQINAFSELDLSGLLSNYSSLVDLDILSMTLCRYDLKEGNIDNPDGLHEAVVRSELLLRDYYNGSINERHENIEIQLIKSGRCKTQAVCAPSLMKCESCGGSLSLLEGKKCTYCGHELDLKKYDWVITSYRISK